MFVPSIELLAVGAALTLFQLSVGRKLARLLSWAVCGLVGLIVAGCVVVEEQREPPAATASVGEAREACEGQGQSLKVRRWPSGRISYDCE